jgi:hypothetical protein
MNARSFADPSDDSKLILEYDAYVKTTVRNGGIPLTPDAWQAQRQTPKPVPETATEQLEYTEHETQKIQNAFSNLMVAAGFGSQAERKREELRQWYNLKREVNRVFEKLIDVETTRRMRLKGLKG